MAQDENSEKEVKLAIKNIADHKRLIAALPKPETRFTQTNIYLDDKERRLKKHSLMLRAREIQFPPGSPIVDPPVTLTAKRRREQKDGLFISDEYNQVISMEEWENFQERRDETLLEGKVINFIRSITEFGPLEIIGSMKNERYQVRSDLYILEIDLTTFPDGTQEAEIECESPWLDKAKAHIEHLCRQLEIEISPQTKSKYVRFLERL